LALRAKLGLSVPSVLNLAALAAGQHSRVANSPIHLSKSAPIGRRKWSNGALESQEQNKNFALFCVPSAPVAKAP
jgi:hypothetical protein